MQKMLLAQGIPPGDEQPAGAVADGLLDVPLELLEHIFSFVASSSEGHAWMFSLREVCRRFEAVLDREFTTKCFKNLSVFFLDRDRLESLKRITSEKRITRHIASLTLTLDPYLKSHGDVGETIVHLPHGNRQYLEQQYKSFADSEVMLELIPPILRDVLEVATVRRAWLTLDLNHLSALPRRQVGLLKTTARFIMMAIHHSEYPLDRLVTSDQLKFTHELHSAHDCWDPWLDEMLRGNGLGHLNYRADLSSISSQHTADSDTVRAEVFRHYDIVKALHQSPDLHEFAFETAFATGPWPAFAVLTRQLFRANNFTQLGRIRLNDVVCNVTDLLSVLRKCRDTLYDAHFYRIMNTSIEHDWHDVFRALQDRPINTLLLSSLCRWDPVDAIREKLLFEFFLDDSGISYTAEWIREPDRVHATNMLKMLVDFPGEPEYVEHNEWEVPYLG